MSLLERFRQDSELDSVGHFTLDEKRAKDKMAHFQLVHRHDFLLLVVQAVVAAGCRAIEILSDEQRVELRAVGAQLALEQLNQLENYLFDNRPESLSYYLLGVARNAVSPFCTEEPRVEMEGQDLLFTVSPREPYLDLAQHLRRSLLYCPCEVTLNEHALPRIPLSGGRMISLCDGEASVLNLVRHGVVVGRKLVESEVVFQAVYSESGFIVDASFFEVVEGEFYQQILRDAKLAALQLLADQVAQYQPGDSGRLELLERLAQSLPDPAGRALRNCPLFAMADREQVLSYTELVQAKGVTGLLFHSPIPLNLQLKNPVIFIDHPLVLETLNKLLPGALQDASQEYRKVLERLQRIADWEASPRPTELPPSNYLATRKLKGPDWQAEIGYLSGQGGSHIDMLYEGKLLCSERLDDLPPGATAVINFEAVEINESWTRPCGRHFRSILKTLQTHLESLFDDLELTCEQLHPALREYIDERFRDTKEPVPRVAARISLFPTVSGPRLSFEKILQLPTIALGNQVVFSSNIPSDLLPEPLLLYESNTAPLLKSRLGGQVQDLRSYQTYLAELDQKLSSPQKPTISRKVHRKESLDKEDLTGEIGLDYEFLGSKADIVLFFRGAPLDEIGVNMTKLIRGYGAVELARLRPNDRWDGIERDKNYRLLIKWLRERFRDLEESALQDGRLPPALFLKLLEAYSGSLGSFSEKKVLESTTPGKYHSLHELKAELETYGELLRGPMGVRITGRLVLHERSKDRGFQEAQLREHLGSFRWVNASKLAKKLELAQGFQARRVHHQIKVQSGRGGLTLSAGSCPGEVAVGLNEEGRYVDCYYGGRFVCKKPDLLPRGSAAAIDSELLELSEDFNDAKLPPALLDELLRVVEEGFLKCAVQHGDLVARRRALEYAREPEASEEFLKELRELPLFLLQGGGTTSLMELEAEDCAPAYVEPDFPSAIQPDRLVIRAHPEDTALIRARTKLFPYKAENHLMRLDQDRQYLASLPSSIPDRLLFRRTYVLNERLSLELAPYSGTSLLGFDEEGAVLGYLGFNTVLPVWGTVRPARPGKRDKQKNPTAEVTRTEESWIHDRIDELYIAWVEDLARREFTEHDKDQAFQLLSLTRHELGSSSMRALLAQKLWGLPLFRLVDGTRVSGESLAERLHSERGPLLISSERWRVPGHTPLLKPESREHSLLRAVLGKECLHWYEAPPLVDTERLKSKVSKLVAWGFSPLTAMQRKLEAVAESWETALQKKRVPEQKPVPKPKRQADASPEERLLSLMQMEARTLLGTQTHRNACKFFSQTRFGSWILGPPIYWTDDICCFNRLHPTLRWLVQLDPKNSDKHCRAARILLLIHWVDLINVKSPEFSDTQEREFLQKLSERMIQTFS